MNAQILYLVAVLASAPELDGGDFDSVYQPSPVFEAAIRGQSPTYDEDPNSAQSYSGSGSPYYGGSPTVVPNGTTYAPYSGQPIFQDPFMQPYGGASPYPYAGVGPGGMVYGANGPQPYRLGWTLRANSAILPKVGTSSPGGFKVFEFNTALNYSALLPSGWVFSAAQEFNLRNWEGPIGAGIPGAVYRFGWDLELAAPSYGPFSSLFVFNPSINTSFENSLGDDAFNWDGWGMIFYRPVPQWMFALGAGYWDRVNDQWLPYAGVVYNPNDRWEFRLLFPESQISYFWGCNCGVSHWLYINGEYHVEAYQISLANTGIRDQVQLRDWRIMLGWRMDTGAIQSFIEAGWVLGRQVDFKRSEPFDFSISDGFLARIGLRF